MKKVLLPVLALFLAFSVHAQIRTPSASPTANFSTTVGLTDVAIEYSRPSAKDRVIFAEDGLVPFGNIWRTGANSATKLSFSDAVTIGGVEVEAGDYAVLTMPMASEWKFMLYPYESGSWGSYVEKDPAAAFMVPAAATGHMVETFTIGVNNVRNESATIDFAWENTMVSVPLAVNVHDRVMANIKQVMAGPTMNDYYAAASYMHDAGVNLEQALEYIQMATSSDDARYWVVRREALILADLGRTDEAIKAANRSMELAKAAGNNDYVRMNQKSIEEWSND
jgi:hypothetical protein